MSQTGFPTRSIGYDLLNRTATESDGVNPNLTVYSYDSLHLRTITDPAGQVYRYTFNALGWLVKRTSPEGLADSLEYAVDGTLRRYVNRRGQSVDETYDALDRPLTKSGTNTPSESWSYSANGRVITAVSVVSTDVVYRNVSGQLDSVSTSIAGQTFWRRYFYDASGGVDSVRTAGGGLSFVTRRWRYDTLTHTMSGFGLDNLWTQFTYNADDNSIADSLPGGDAIRTELGPTQRVVSVGATSSGWSYADSVARALGVDPTGRVHRQFRDFGIEGIKAAPTKVSIYGYDGLGRLTADTSGTRTVTYWLGCDAGQDEGYGCGDFWSDWTVNRVDSMRYDPVGNRLDNGGVYTTGNRISTFMSCSYAHDPDGNITTRVNCPFPGPVTFSWTAENRLAGYSVGGGDTVTFFYNALGQLVRRDVNGVPTSIFLWDGDNLLAELNGAATEKISEYSYGSNDRLHSVVVGGVRYYAHADGIGNVIGLTTATLSLARTYHYDAYGNTIPSGDYSGLQGHDRARWKGALWFGDDGVELYYMRGRWYEPRTGRFLSEEPVDISGDVNPYSYGGDDPVNYADPSGGARCVVGYEPDQFYSIDGIWYIKGGAAILGDCPDNTYWEGAGFFNGAAERSCNGQMVLWPLCTPDPETMVDAAERLGSYLQSKNFKYGLWWKHGVHKPGTVDCSHFVHQALEDAGCDAPYVSTADISNNLLYYSVPPAVGTIWVVRHADGTGHMGIVGELDRNGRPKVVQAGHTSDYWNRPVYQDRWRAGDTVKYYLPVCR